MIDTADDNRLVRVAFEEVDDHFLANARDVNAAQSFPAQGWDTRTQQDESSFFFPSRSQWILNFYPAILVRVDLLAAGAGHDRGLTALDTGFGSHPRRAEGNAGRTTSNVFV